LLDRLFDEAATAWDRAKPTIGEISPEERDRCMRSKTEYLDFYGRLKDLPLSVSRETGVLLYMLARGCGARTIVEFGTSFGITEFEPSKVERARNNLSAGGLVDLVESRVGDALQTLSRDLPETIDLLLLDGAKSLYPEILGLVESRLRQGAFILADDANHSPEYLAWVRSPANGYLSVPFAEDIELSIRIN
jgi:predicted O-methyltransferase YrrM